MTVIHRLYSLLLSLLLLPFRDPWRTVVGQRYRFDVDASELRPVVAQRVPVVPGPGPGPSPCCRSAADEIQFAISIVFSLVAVYLRLRNLR